MVDGWLKISGLYNIMYYGTNRKTFILNGHAITNLVIPSNVTFIPNSAFSYFINITSVLIPDSVTIIGISAFEGCSSLADITLPFIGSSKDGTSHTHFGYIFGASKYYDYYNYDSTDHGNAYHVPKSLKTVTITGGTSIASNAFYKCSNITNITIPNSVTSIGEEAFCNCSSLASVTIPDSVTIIGQNAFEGCTSLTNITIPDSVISIGSDAFHGCSSLANINYLGTIESWCNIQGLYNLMEYGTNSKTFSLNGILVTEIVIPNTVTSIPSRAFANINITSVTITDGVTSIGYAAFYNCSSLTSITILDSVTSISGRAFRNCTSLTNVTISDSVTSIDSQAFYDCRSLTSVTIPDSVTSIDSQAFYDCRSLTIYCEAGSKPEGWNSSWNYSYCPVVWDCNNNDKDKDGNIYAVIDGIRYELKDNVATVIRQPSNITEANISQSVTHNGTNYAVTNIGVLAFRDCNSLTSVTIPDSVTSIGYEAFYGCSSLKNVYYIGTAEDWKKISIDSHDNSSLTSATRYYYSETEPALNADDTAYDGNYWHYNENGEIFIWTKGESVE